MNNKKNKMLLTILLICVVFIIVVFSIISLRTYSVETEDFEAEGHYNVSSPEIFNKPQSADKYVVRNIDQVTNTSNDYITCNNGRCILNNIPGTRTQSYSNNLCWAYGASNAIETTLLNSKRSVDPDYTAPNANPNYGGEDIPRFSPTHMGYSLSKEFSDGQNEYGYMYITDGGFALDSILYLTNGIGPIKAPNAISGNPFDVNKYEYSGNANTPMTLLARNVIIKNPDYSVDYKINEIQMISGIDKDLLPSSESGYDDDLTIQNRINTMKDYLKQGYGVTIESRSLTQGDSGKCDCSRGTGYHNTYCPIGDHGNTCFYHVTLVVGWDDNYDRTNFVSEYQPPANGAWIVRNSLNESNSTYYYISYYDYRSLTNDTLAITDLVKYGNNNTKYDKLYQYNPSGCETWSYTNKHGVTSYICKDFNRINTQKIANVYDRNNNSYKENLTEVSFFVNKATTVSIYYKEGSTVDDALFTSNNLIGTKQVLVKGYYTIPISGIKINDNNFVIGLSSSESGQVFAFQGKSNPSINNLAGVGITSGISYYKSNDSVVWKDTAIEKNATNFIKVYTKNTNEPVEEPENPVVEVTYKVRYYKETLTDNEYNEVTSDMENRTGHIGDVVEIVPGKNYTGFIKPDNQTITLSENTPDVLLKYKRSKHTITLNRGEGISEVVGSGTYKFEENVLLNATVSEGYIWKNWTNIDGTIVTESQSINIQMPNNDIEYTANAIPITSPVENTISISPTSLELYANGTQSEQYGQLTATVTGNNSGIEWFTTDSTVAIVDNGLVSAKGPGVATIIAKISGTEISASCHVVVKVKVERIYFEQDNVTVKEGMSITLNPIIEPSNATDKSLQWSSSNEDVAVVENSVVRGVSPGIATITVRTGNGKVATCTITVEKNADSIIPVTGVTVTPKSLTMYVGNTYGLAYTVEPSGATDKNVIWSSDNEKVASVDSKGMVTALKSGMALVTVRSADGKHKAQSVIVVIAKPASSSSSGSSLKPSSSTSSTVTPTIKMNEKNISLLKGSHHVLTIRVTGSSKNIVWSSTNPDVATVDNGKVVGISLGKTTIIAKIEGTNISDKCEVEVISDEKSGISFVSQELVVYLGKTKNIELITTPTDMKIESKKYEVEDKEVISISDDIVTGLKLGKSKLRVRVNDKYEAETLVVVMEEPMSLVISGYDIAFSEDIYSYELKIKREKELNITSNKDITISGNENLKNKSVIKVTNVETNKTYEIMIKKSNSLIILLIITAVVIFGIAVFAFVKRRKD